MTVQRPAPDGTFPWTANWGWPDELASWNWDDHKGKPLKVRVYTAGDKVQAILNGQVVGEKALAAGDKMTAELPVPYAAGTLEAVAWKNGKVIGRTHLETVGEAVSLRVSAEPLSQRRGRDALAYLKIEVVDAKGRVLPDDMRPVTLALEGSGELAAFGSANPQAVGSLNASHTRTFRGKALAILRGRGKGTLRITAHSPGLRAANARVAFE
jgi:beta-galactosidase